MSDLDDKRKKVPLDQTAIEQLTALRYFVDNLNKQADLALRGGVYRELSKADIYTTSFNGWEVGYILEDHNVYFTKKVFLKCEQPLEEVPEEEKNGVAAAVMQVMLDRGQSMPDVEQIAPNCVLFTQNFMPIYQIELNPNLVSKGRQVH